MSLRLKLKEFLFNNNFLYRNTKFAELIAYYYLKKCHEDDYYFYELFGNRKEITIIDIGANYGQSVISFASVLPHAKIISFEPNLDCIEYLEMISKFTQANYEFHKVGLGSKEIIKDLYIPKIKNTLVTQEASFDRDQLNQPDVIDRIGNNFEIVKQESTIKKLDNYNLCPDIIKIDVQGLEEDVLRGSLETIKKYLPSLMIESNRHNNFIFETLKDCDYQVFTFNKALKCLKSWDLDEDIPFEENLIYLTKEHIKEFNIEA